MFGGQGKGLLIAMPAKSGEDLKLYHFNSAQGGKWNISGFSEREVLWSIWVSCC